MNDWLGVAGFLLAMIALLAGARTLQQWKGWHPEVARKTIHIMLGLATLSLPWLFDSTWPAWLLAVLVMGIFVIIRVWHPVRASLGEAIHGVERSSLGEFCFPLAVALLFQLAEGDPTCFLIPILILTLADATGALVGVRYGKALFRSGSGNKSAEGSIAFFVVAFLSVHVPLLLLTETGRAESLLIAVIVGVMVMLMEAVSWRGLDNLFVPLLAFLALEGLLDKGTEELVLRLGLLILLGLAASLPRSFIRIEREGILGALLFAFVFWSVAGKGWLLPVLLLYSYHLILPIVIPVGADSVVRARDFQGVLRVFAGPTFFLLLGLFGGMESAAWRAFTLTFACHLAIMLATRTELCWKRMECVLRNLLAGGLSAVLLWIPCLLYRAEFFWPHAVIGILAGIITALLLGLLHHDWFQHTRLGLWSREALLPTACGALALLL